MTRLIDHLLKLTDHRERDLLELTLAKAMIDLLPVQRVVLAKVIREENDKRWFEQIRLDVRGGGKVGNLMQIDFKSLPALADATDRAKCLQTRTEVEVAWAGEAGPRITYFPLFADTGKDDEGVIEVHSDAPLTDAARESIGQLRRVYRNMYALLEYSDRDALTGLLNRKSLDDAFYSAVLEAMDGVAGQARAATEAPAPGDERRHRVPANYWLGSAMVDNFGLLNAKHGHLIAEEVLLLVARIMNNTFRTYDQIYRFGGEHFGVLMHCPQEAVVLAAFDRFRVNVEKFTFPQVGRITVSCGFTSVTADDSPSTAIEKTVRALEHVRKSSGNAAASYLDLVRKGMFGVAPKVGGVDIF
jgi:diguanylate cyclase (GGDEF)-like protein